MNGGTEHTTSDALTKFFANTLKDVRQQRRLFRQVMLDMLQGSARPRDAAWGQRLQRETQWVPPQCRADSLLIEAGQYEHAIFVAGVFLVWGYRILRSKVSVETPYERISTDLVGLVNFTRAGAAVRDTHEVSGLRRLPKRRIPKMHQGNSISTGTGKGARIPVRPLSELPPSTEVAFWLNDMST